MRIHNIVNWAIALMPQVTTAFLPPLASDAVLQNNVSQKKLNKREKIACLERC
jgi:hypothetical protein